MTLYRHTIGTRTHRFDSLKDVLAKASGRRTGDELAGLAAATDEERMAARLVLAEIPLSQFVAEPIIPYEADDVTRLICDRHRPLAQGSVLCQTVGEFREWLLRYETTSSELQTIQSELTPEVVAAVSKLMRNQDLILVAAKCEVVTRFRNTLGKRGHLATRIQPNHPTDDPQGIGAAILDGLCYGCGDAVIGINPATDNVGNCLQLLRLMDDVITRFQIPTQSCVLAHVTTMMEAMRRKAPVDLVFQSIAGTQQANESFGISLEMLAEARSMALELNRGSVGHNVMYFETGQGSCLSAKAHWDVDQQTCEARAYAVAREFDPLLVNTVVGFIGPEYLYDGKQILRAGLEDHFCGKLLGLPMGCDVCYTNHSEADQDDMDTLLSVLGMAGCNYIMGIPGADDIMLGYQSTSFHDSHFLRQTLGLRPAPEFERWLRQAGILNKQNQLQTIAPNHRLLAAADPVAISQGQP